MPMNFRLKNEPISNKILVKICSQKPYYICKVNRLSMPIYSLLHHQHSHWHSLASLYKPSLSLLHIFYFIRYSNFISLINLQQPSYSQDLRYIPWPTHLHPYIILHHIDDSKGNMSHVSIFSDNKNRNFFWKIAYLIISLSFGFIIVLSFSFWGNVIFGFIAKLATLNKGE